MNLNEKQDREEALRSVLSLLPGEEFQKEIKLFSL
jgi:hypothetical protein